MFDFTPTTVAVGVRVLEETAGVAEYVIVVEAGKVVERDSSRRCSRKCRKNTITRVLALLAE